MGLSSLRWKPENPHVPSPLLQIGVQTRDPGSDHQLHPKEKRTWKGERGGRGQGVALAYQAQLGQKVLALEKQQKGG